MGRSMMSPRLTEEFLDHERPPFDRKNTASVSLIATPPFTGREYLDHACATTLWERLGTRLAALIDASGESLEAWLAARHASWSGVGRVCFHLAENKADPARPFAFPFPQGNTLLDVAAISASDFVAVGEAGTILRVRRTPAGRTTYDLVQLESGSTLRAVCVVSEREMYAVGDGTTFVHFDGTQWSPAALPTGVSAGTELRGISCLPDGTVFLAAGSSVVRIAASSGAVEFPLLSGRQALAVWALAADNIYVGTDAGMQRRSSRALALRRLLRAARRRAVRLARRALRTSGERSDRGLRSRARWHGRCGPRRRPGRNDRAQRQRRRALRVAQSRRGDRR